MSRNPMIAKLHIAKKDLRLSDDDYRAVLTSATGKTSSRDMSDAELVAALDAFKKLGFKPSSNGSFRKAESPLARKIYALWGALADAGAVDDRSNAALSKWLTRQMKIARPEWLKPDQANAAIEALKAWLDRTTAA